MELILGYLAGVLTLINPCVLPVLPIALASAAQNDWRGPALLALGMSITFVFIGVTVSAVGSSIGLDSETVSKIGAGLMIGFGCILLIPRLNTLFVFATAGLSANADSQIDSLNKSDQNGYMGLKNQLLGGLLLGAVWSPCIGPTLGGAISLASQGQSLWWATLIMMSFAAGISTIILALAYGARETIRARQTSMRALASKSKPIMGVTFVGVGLVILLDLYQEIEGWLFDIMPIWLQDLSVML